MADNLSIIRKGYEAFAKGDIPTVLGLFDSGIEWNEPENSIYWPGAPHSGAKDIAGRVFSRLPQDYDGFHIEIDRMVDAGDTVLVEGRYRATAKATGKPVDAQMAHVWDLRGGKVVRLRQYADTWQLAKAHNFTPKG